MFNNSDTLIYYIHCILLTISEWFFDSNQIKMRQPKCKRQITNTFIEAICRIQNNNNHMSLGIAFKKKN